MTLQEILIAKYKRNRVLFVAGAGLAASGFSMKYGADIASALEGLDFDSLSSGGVDNIENDVNNPTETAI